MTDVLNVPDMLIQVGVAIAIGGLIGLEREKEPRKFAGVRTLALLSGAGPVMVAVSDLAEYPLVIAVYLSLAAGISLTIAYIRFSIQGDEVGFTTSVAVFLVALLGVLVGYGRLFEATSIAIVAAFLLAEKQRMLTYIDRLTYEELSDSVKLGALVFILYPILPTEPVDPFGIVNLREVLVFAIFVLMIQFAAYVSMRQFGGSKGLQVTGLLAGGVNSFATAGVMARLAHRSPDATDSASSALLLATGSMIVRNVGIATVLAFAIFWALWMPTVAMTGLAIVIAYLLWSQGMTNESFDIDLESPFSFMAAIKFSVVYVSIVVASVVAQELFGETGLLATSFLGGLVSSAAVSVSAATVYNDGSVALEPAAGMVLLGILASLTSKIVLVELINKRMRLRAAVPMAGVGVLGLIVFMVV